MELYNC